MSLPDARWVETPSEPMVRLRRDSTSALQRHVDPDERQAPPRMEGQIAISALLRRFAGMRLAVMPGSLRWRRGGFLRGLERLPLVL